MAEPNVIVYVGELFTSVRIDWGAEVVGRCQAAVGQLLVFSRGTWRSTFDELARTLPSPDSAAERLFLYDRLRSLTRAGAVRFHATFHNRCPGRPCRGTLIDES